MVCSFSFDNNILEEKANDSEFFLIDTNVALLFFVIIQFCRKSGGV